MKNEKKLSLLLLLQTAFTKDITCFSTIWYRLHLSLYFRPGIWACNHLKMTCYMLTDQEPIALVLTQMRVAWVWMPVRWKWMQRALDQPALSDELGMRMHCYFKQVIVIMIWSKSSIHERLSLWEANMARGSLFKESGGISVCKGQGSRPRMDPRDLWSLRRCCIIIIYQ